MPSGVGSDARMTITRETLDTVLSALRTRDRVACLAARERLIAAAPPHWITSDVDRLQLQLAAGRRRIWRHTGKRVRRG